MIMVNSVQAVTALLDLAREIAREEHISFKSAVVRAGHERANFLVDIERGVPYRPTPRRCPVPIVRCATPLQSRCGR